MGRYSACCSALAAAAVMGIGAARAAEPTVQQLTQQIQDLQARVQHLEARQDERSLSAQQVDATVERVLADAEQRSRLLQMEGFTAGFSKGRFTIQDAAGNWVLRPSLHFQFRAVANIRDGGDGADSDRQKGFEIPRARFGFDGNAFTPRLSYNFVWNTVTNGGGLVLETAWLRYFFTDNWAVHLGQFPNPTFREQSIGSRQQLAVERSLANFLVTGSGLARSQAVSLMYDNSKSPLLAEFGAEDGFNSQNTDFTDPSSGGTNDWGAFGRVTYFAMGPRSEFADFTALGNTQNLLAIGAGLDVTQTGGTTVYRHTVDAQWETASGLGIYGAYLGNFSDAGSGGENLFNWGLLVQAAYMLTDRWELFGRYDYTKFDANALASGLADEYCEIVLGANWYVGGGHNAKLTLDFVYLPNGSPLTYARADILASSDAEYLFRGQFQLLL